VALGFSSTDIGITVRGVTSSRPYCSTEDLAGLAALEDPVRRRLYDYVCERDEAVGRDEAARATTISRSLAAYHLDKLARHGLLRASYRRADGRTGPGAGRPAKLYERPEREIGVSIPPRDYELAAHLLAHAVAEGEDAARAAARERGRELARDDGNDRRSRPGALQTLLRERGYQPVEEPDGTLRLRNCPFHTIAVSHPELVCGFNLALLEGVLDGLGRSQDDARLDTQPGRCCVAIHCGE
jgi:predicted ArsR family transcriptional regulator